MKSSQNSSASEVKVMIVLIRRLLLRAVADLFARYEGIQIVAEAQDVEEAVNAARAGRPDVALIGVSPPTLDPVEFARRLSEDEHLETKVIVIARDIDFMFMRKTLSSHVSGFLSWDSDAEDVLLTIRAVRRGLTILCPQAREVISYNQFSSPLPEDKLARMQDLSSREREALNLMMEGFTNKEIAHALGIGVRTAEMHAASVIAKLGARSRTDAILMMMSAVPEHPLETHHASAAPN